jgi:LmbE family N-acetylglucosaminyl deacetylase
MGHAVQFVSVTNGDAGHYEMRGPALAARRRAEAMEAARRLGVAAEVLDFHDGELLPTIEARREIIRLIREWRADVVMGPRPNDYHPDHRACGLLVQDAAYMVTVPAVVPETAALRKNPIFLYFEDPFQRPNPFRADVTVEVGAVLEAKLHALDAHESQFYEWLPWLDGRLDEVPGEAGARREWLARQWPAFVRPAEAFEICEYGARADAGRVRELLAVAEPRP